MKIYILSSNPNLDSTKKLLNAFGQGNDISVYNPLDLHFSLANNLIFDQNKKIKLPDLVVPRFGWMTYNHGIKVLKAFESFNITTLNNSQAIELAFNKLSSLSILNKNKIPIPETHYYDPSQNNFPLKMKAPLVIKTLTGSQGWGVTLAKNKTSAISNIQQLRNVQAEYLIQKYIPGIEVRVLACRNKILASMIRKPKKGEFRSNIHQGGKAIKTSLNSKEIEIVLKTLNLFKLDYAGIDFIRSKNGIKVIEVNPFPGFSAISKVYKNNLANRLADLIFT